MEISCCWIYAISKYGYPPSMGDTYKVIEEMTGMGFKNIELEGIGEKNLKEIVKDKEKLKKTIEDLGVKVVNFCPVLPDIVSLKKERRDKAVELFKIGIDVARYFNCVTIQTDSFTPPLKFIGEAPYKKGLSYGKEYKVKLEPDFIWQEQWNVLVDTFAHCTSLAKDAGLKFCLEPRVGELISNTDAALRLIDAIGDNGFGVVFDTAHQHAQKELLPLSVEKLGKKIFYLHVADNDGRDNEHLALGKGIIDWEELFFALKKHHFNGYVAIDVGGKIQNLREEVIKSKKYLEELGEKIKF